MTTTSANAKLDLQAFLRVLTSAGMPFTNACSVAQKVYKTHSTPAALGKITELQLKTLGVSVEKDRKQALAAFRKAGYKSAAAAETAAGGSIATTSTSGAGAKGKDRGTGKTPAAKKRKRDDDLNELLPSRPPNEGEALGSLEFNEIYDEDVLRTKSTVVNRAPVMNAWATVVAERLGFKREEALSIASAYTEMNAISKGVSLGIFNEGKGKGVELVKGATQPYVDLMGRRYAFQVSRNTLDSSQHDSGPSVYRRIPLYNTKSGDWRALIKGEPVDPATAFSYMQRAFRQTMPYILGAMRLLAESYTPTALNEKGFTLYADFRPQADAWGQRSEMRCAGILALRKQVEANEDGRVASKSEEAVDKSKDNEVEKQATLKKPKIMSVEEYEALLDADDENPLLQGDF